MKTQNPPSFPLIKSTLDKSPASQSQRCTTYTFADKKAGRWKKKKTTNPHPESRFNIRFSPLSNESSTFWTRFNVSQESGAAAVRCPLIDPRSERKESSRSLIFPFLRQGASCVETWGQDGRKEPGTSARPWTTVFFIPRESSRRAELVFVRLRGGREEEEDWKDEGWRGVESVASGVIEMSDLQATLEFSLELCKFYNVDLFQRG